MVDLTSRDLPQVTVDQVSKTTTIRLLILLLYQGHPVWMSWRSTTLQVSRQGTRWWEVLGN